MLPVRALRLRAPSVRVQFVMMALLALVTTGVATVVYIPQYQEAILEEQLERRVGDLSAFVADRCAVAVRKDDLETTTNLIQRLASDASIAGAQLFDDAGGVVAQSGEGLQLKVRPRWLEWEGVRTIRNASRTMIVVPVYDAMGRVGTLLVLARREATGERIAEEKRFLLGLLLLSVITGVFVALAFGGLLARRISRLRFAAERVANGDFDLRIPIHADDEIGLLTREFNRMVEELRRTTTSRDALSREVHERRRAYERIRVLKEKAEDAARVKSEFLANMSHEIRTPMNGVIGMTDLALETELSDEQREYLTMAKSSAESLLAIIDDILDFSKIEAGKLVLDPVEVALPEIVGSALRTFAIKCHEKGIDLIGSIDPDVPERIVVDPLRLRQVLVNFVGNAVKFTDRGEIVTTISVESLDGPSAVLHFAVRDTGIGISPDRCRSIFDAFSQADGSTTRKYGGTGLGLSISSQLIELMGGTVWVDSEVGVGSTFHFTIDCGLPLNDITDPATVATLTGRSVGVLIENATERMVIARMLGSKGMRVEVFDQPQSALDELADPKRQPDLLIVDYLMHDIDGLEFVSELGQMVQFGGEIILLKYPGVLQIVGARSRQFGIAATVNKPVLASDLIPVVARVFAESTLPRSRPEMSPSRQGSETDGRALRVLLAEDNPVNQKLAVRMLEKRGHEVNIVGDGARAVEVVTSEPFDLVLMDIQM
ncbi:MAG: response regulator, partial [Planctomycetes bacterium]|nr:response regulator [Planctomycetota bacterium]